MRIFRRFVDIVANLFERPFRVKYFDDDPDRADLSARMFAVVGTPQLQKYAHFLCPCGCGDVIVLTSNAKLRPRWTFLVDQAHRPTVTPSIWRTKGCRSHFLMKGGKVIWVGETARASRTDHDALDRRSS